MNSNMWTRPIMSGAIALVFGLAACSDSGNPVASGPEGSSDQLSGDKTGAPSGTRGPRIAMVAQSRYLTAMASTVTAQQICSSRMVR